MCVTYVDMGDTYFFENLGDKSDRNEKKGKRNR